MTYPRTHCASFLAARQWRAYRTLGSSGLQTRRSYRAWWSRLEGSAGKLCVGRLYSEDGKNRRRLPKLPDLSRRAIAIGLRHPRSGAIVAVHYYHAGWESVGSSRGWRWWAGHFTRLALSYSTPCDGLFLIYYCYLLNDALFSLARKNNLQ